ncbi:MAG: X2-like carbohydrate binding domain-containing protein [Clostridia bacterium]|nr:X2-like carbohydrate binding domain-containing protein [Clostridia bacterium]
MNFKKIIASALSATMVLSSMALTAFADASLTLEVSKSEVVRGDSFTVSLPIDAAANIGSAEITLDYDESAFTCESGTTEFGDVVFNPAKDLGSGNLGAYFSINDVNIAKKTGKLFVATFKAKSDATGGLKGFSVTEITIKGASGNPIAAYTVVANNVEVKAPEQLGTPSVTIDRDTKKATWPAVTYAADYNVVLTKNGAEIYNNNQTATEFDFRKYVTETADYTVSITEKDYVTGSNGFDVVITPNGNTFTGITGLTEGMQYTKNENVIHIKGSYLDALSADTPLTFDFDNGTDPVLTVKIKKAATGATFILAERAAADKYFNDSKQDVDTTANDGATEGLIVISDPEAPVTNFIGTQFSISNNAEVGYDSVDYEIVPADGFALLYDEATGLYEINVKPVDGVRPAVAEDAAGKGIVIAKLVCSGGYGKGTIKAENIMMTVETSDNTYREVTATNAGFEFKYDIPEPAANLTVNVNLSKLPTKVDNVKAYQNMQLRVYSARLGFIDFDLGTDAVDYSEKNGTLQTEGAVSNDAAAKTYTLTLNNLPKYDKYTVFVSGDGYRDAKVLLYLKEDTTVDCCNKANDSEIAQVTKATSGIVKTAKKNFLAGDIIMNGTIDLYDLSAVSSYYGKTGLTAGDADYIQYDLNRDGKVNILDITMLLAGWAE